MFFLTSLGNLTRFRRSTIKSEAYLVTENVCIKSHGVLLAARSSILEEMLKKSENIPVLELSDNMAGLEDCLDLVYGGSVSIGENNFKAIYKFGKLFQIREMMDGVSAWIANDVKYDEFWKVYLDLKSLHADKNKLEFIAAVKRYLSAGSITFLEHTTEICRSQDKNTITAVVELLSRINDIRMLSILQNIIDTATEDIETLVNTTPSTDNNNYLQEVVSSAVTLIENYLKSGSCDEFTKSRCKKTLQKASSVCMNMETLRTINKISLDTSIQLSSCWNFTAQSIKDLNWERIKQLTSPTTSYDAIKYFTEHAGTGIHPCVVVEIVLKWWSVRTDTEHVDMSFIKPLITTIQNVSNWWHKSICRDEKYKGLMETLDIPAPTTSCYIFYGISGNNNNKRNLKDCISIGDGSPVQLEDLECSNNMERYRQSVPAFRYNTAVFPPYGDTKHHWFITIYSDNYTLVSIITHSKEEILSYINNTSAFTLRFVPLPDTLQ